MISKWSGLKTFGHSIVYRIQIWVETLRHLLLVAMQYKWCLRYLIGDFKEKKPSRRIYAKKKKVKKENL